MEVEILLKDKLKEINSKMGMLNTEKKKIKKALRCVRELIPHKIELEKKLTFKDMAKIALSEHFLGGATGKQIFMYCRGRWPDRYIGRQSFSPQLSRLKTEGILRLDGKIWRLANTDNAQEGE